MTTLITVVNGLLEAEVNAYDGMADTYSTFAVINAVSIDHGTHLSIHFDGDDRVAALRAMRAWSADLLLAVERRLREEGDTPPLVVVTASSNAEESSDG